MKHKKMLKVFGLVAVLAALMLVAIAPAAAQEDAGGSHTISVSGYGSANGAPDIAYLQLGVNMTGENVGELVTNVNATLEAVRDALLEAGIAVEDMQTANFNLWSDMPYQEGRPSGERFFRAENMLRVTIREVDTVDAVIQAALDAGATNIFGLNFAIEDTTELEQEARLDAIADARDRAEKLADALGLTLGEPVSVSEGFGGSPATFEAAAMGFGGGGGGGPVVEPGQFTVSLTVHISFSIEQ